MQEVSAYYGESHLDQNKGKAMRRVSGSKEREVSRICMDLGARECRK